MKDSSCPLLVVLMAVESPWSVDIACRLSKSNYRVIVARSQPALDKPASDRAREGLQRLADHDISVVDVSQGPRIVPSFVRLACNLKSLCRRMKANHLLTLYGGSFAIAACLSGFRPYSVYWVGSDINLPGRFRTICMMPPFRFATLNIVNGRSLAKATERRFGARNLVELYIGVDAEVWKFEPDKRPGRIVCTRWFEPVYDNATIIEAFFEADGAANGMSLVFTSSGSELARGRELVRSRSNDDRSGVTFLGGVDRRQLQIELSQAESFVSMSRSDGTSTALLEALACGAFPVLSDIPANREWKDHGCDLELVKAGDISGLSKALVRVHADAERRRCATIRNREIVERVASSDRNMMHLAQMLRTASDRGAPHYNDRKGARRSG
mgnify:CR=1 FL=1